MTTNEREYPNLVSCNVTVRNENFNQDRPPIRLPADIVEAYGTNNTTSRQGPASNSAKKFISRIPKPYDFALEHEILAKQQDRENESLLLAALTINEKNEEKESIVDTSKKSAVVSSSVTSTTTAAAAAASSSNNNNNYSGEELSRSLVAKMKSFTNASEEVCISLLEKNSFDLNTSIEAYLSTYSNDTK